MKFTICMLCLFCLTAGNVFGGELEDLTVLTSPSPPYSYQRNGVREGYASELVKLLLRELGISPEIKSYPQGRMQLMSTENTLLYPMLRTAANEADYRWIGKIADRRISYFRLKGRSDMDPADPEFPGSLKIGVIRSSHMARVMKERGYAVQEVATDIQNLKKLYLGRIDLIVQDDLVLLHSIDEYNKNVPPEERIDVNDFDRCFAYPSGDEERGLFIAMSPDSSESLVRRLRRVYADILCQGPILEVAHWWTNDVELEMLEVYRRELIARGFGWTDYSLAGGAGAKMETVLTAREQTGNLPHAVQSYLGPAVWDWAQKADLLKLNDAAESEGWEESLYPFVYKRLFYEGNLVAVPVNVQRVNWVWINPKLFEIADLAYPTDAVSFLNCLKSFDALGIRPLAMGPEPWQECTLFENLVLSVGGGDLYRAAFLGLNPDALNSPQMREAFRIFREAAAYTANDPDDSSWVRSAALVAEGAAAMYVMGDWVKNVLHASGAEYGPSGYLCFPFPGTEKYFLNNTDVFTFPLMEGRSPVSQLTLASVIMNDGVQEYFNRLKGSVPARRDLDPGLFDRPTQLSMEALETAMVLPSMNYRQALPESLHHRFVAIISACFNGEIDGDAAAAGLADAAREYKEKK